MAGRALGKSVDPSGQLSLFNGMAPPEPLLTVPEVAAWLRVKPSTVYAWVERGELACFRLGGRLRFSRNQVLRWIEAREES